MVSRSQDLSRVMQKQTHGSSVKPLRDLYEGFAFAAAQTHVKSQFHANWYLFSIDGITSWLSQTQQQKNRLCNSTNTPKVLDRVEPNTRRLFCGNKWLGFSSGHF